MAYTTIKKASDYFNTVLFNGDSSSSQAITVGFRPDLTWQKSRNVSANHVLIDQVRGATKVISSDTTAGEDTVDTGTGITTTSTGIIVSEASDWSSINRTGRNIVSWNWLGGNGTVSNTDGSISSTVSANTTSGFSIVSYTGNGVSATVGHGLGAIPKMIIVKDRSTASTRWVVHHKDVTAGNLYLESTDAVGAGKDVGASATSSVFDITTWGNVNASGKNFIAYCFAEKQGFSKFGSYTGNGNADGTFVYTGFKPAFVIVKVRDTINQWGMFDNKREGYNVANDILTANTNGIEETGSYFDILSNGFKARSTSAVTNNGGEKYIYMAFAEEPLVGDNPATAR